MVRDEFVKFIIDNSLNQHVNFPTRFNNIMYSDSHLLHDLCAISPLANSDHASVCCDFMQTLAGNCTTMDSFLMYDYHNTD